MIDLDIFLIDYEISNINSNWWLEILNIFLKAGEKFIVMDVNNDNSFVDKVINSWKNLEITTQNDFVEVSGVLTKKIIKDFNDDYKPHFAEDIDLYCKFNNLKNGNKYCSAHNGREIYLIDITDDAFRSIKNIILPLEEFLKVDVFYS